MDDRKANCFTVCASLRVYQTATAVVEPAGRINIARVEVYSPIVHLRRVKGFGVLPVCRRPIPDVTHSQPPPPSSAK